MKHRLKGLLACLGLAAALPMVAQAAAEKPNILFIMGDDIGIMNVGAYHQGLMVGETPNIDRIANEGARFMTYYAEQSCTAGRTAFSTGMHPLRAGMVMPQLPGATSSLLPGTPAIAKFLLDLGYTPPVTAGDIADEVDRFEGRLSDLESFFFQLIQLERELGLDNYPGF